jgi:hypothetical protein
MSDLQVRGGATPEELGAVLAVLSAGAAPHTDLTGYALWRRTRLRAVRAQVAELAVETSHR